MNAIFQFSRPIVLMFAFLCAGCGLTSEDEISSPSISDDVQMLEGGCDAWYTCPIGITLTCTGTTICFPLQAPPYGVSCDGVQQFCPPPPPPPQSCLWDGNWYQDGYVYGLPKGVRCSSKNGHCVGGPFAGMGCVASPDCFAICDSGAWQTF